MFHIELFDNSKNFSNLEYLLCRTMVSLIILNRCKDLFKRKKYFGVRCTLISTTFTKPLLKCVAPKRYANLCICNKSNIDINNGSVLNGNFIKVQVKNEY